MPLIGSRPAPPVAIAALTGCALAIGQPYTAWGAWLGLQPPPAALLGLLTLLVAGYLTALQLAKIIYRRVTGHWL